MEKAGGWRGLKEKLAPYILLMPFLFVLFVFFGFAFLRVLYFSFTEYNLLNKPVFIGLANYIELFKEFMFARALKNSLTYSIIVTVVQTIGALILAVVLNQKLRGIKFFRAAYYMPSITSSVVITLIFMWLFQRKGVINYLITSFLKYKAIIGAFFLLLIILQALLVGKEKMRRRPVKLLEPSYLVLSLLIAAVLTTLFNFFGLLPVAEVKPVDIIWLNTRQFAFEWLGPLAFPRPLGAIMILNIWTTIPTFMLLYLAGLQDIPTSLYEAAEVDGASSWQRFWYVTVPQLKHITFLVVTMGLIGTLQMFDQVAIIGNQAPKESTITLAYYVYTNIFHSSGLSKAGLASAAAIFLAALTLVITFIQRKFTGEVRD